MPLEEDSAKLVDGGTVLVTDIHVTLLQIQMFGDITHFELALICSNSNVSTIYLFDHNFAEFMLTFRTESDV